MDPNKQASVEIQTTGPSYLGWRGKLLAELALAPVPGLIVHERPNGAPSALPYDFLVSTEHGRCFFVAVRAFSSSRLDVHDVEAVPELRWSVDADLILRARGSESPFVLFLFDADTDHGRYLRLDTLPGPSPAARQVTVRLSVEHVINKENLDKLVADRESATRR
jgi:hypothetical protein